MTSLHCRIPRSRCRDALSRPRNRHKHLKHGPGFLKLRACPDPGTATLQNPDTLALTQELISRASVTPVDGGCQQLMCERLAAAGFRVEKLDYGSVENFWATRGT